jgi:hydrogenase nickel incorporation protein HypA/HybF
VPLSSNHAPGSHDLEDHGHTEAAIPEAAAWVARDLLSQQNRALLIWRQRRALGIYANLLGGRRVIHETGLAKTVLEIVGKAARDRSLSRVRAVVLEIGEASGVQVEALRFAFSVLCPGTVLEGAEITYEISPLILRCRSCDVSYQASLQDPSCPRCRGSEFDIVSGRSLLVKSMTGVSNDRE